MKKNGSYQGDIIMERNLNSLVGFRHLVNSEATRDTSAALQAKVGGGKGKTPVERPVLAAKVGVKVA